MADKLYEVLTGNPERLNVISTKLGTGAIKYTDLDVGKAVKMVDGSAFVLCADGDELGGFIDNIDGGGTAGGFTFGGVARPGQGLRIKAQVAAGAAVLAFGDKVVAGAQIAVGTKGVAQVKKGAPVDFVWQVIRTYGNGSAGTFVLLEKL